jgi:DNA polymerase III delta prime subunit
MSNDRDLDAIFDRIAKLTHTEEDTQTLRQSFRALEGQNTVQIGKYIVNIAEGRDIHIGDRIYQSTDAETIRVIVLQVLAEKIRDETIQRLFPVSESSLVDWDWGMRLLKQKQLPEIRKRLTDTLGRDRILMDVSIEERQRWVNRSPLAADRILQVNGRDCGTLDANKMLIETFGRDDIEKKLLILGAPGAGKTTALLSLAEQLVEGAISQPRTVIPVIFELSTWRNDNQSIESWLIEQLYDLHGGNRKSKLYEQWLERQVLLPLLDGLDELGLERQKKCTQKLNEFTEHYPHLVVCCRVKEFETVDIKLRNLRGAVCLQSLLDSQIQDYFNSLQRPELWGTIQTNSSLQAMLEPTTEGDPGLFRVPLFVKLVVDVYDPQQPISGKSDLLDKYIDRQLSFDKREFDRRKELDEYGWEYKTINLEPDWRKASSNLRWLAQNLQANHEVEFLIEHLQPSSIKISRSQSRYRSLFGLIFGALFGLLLGLSYLMSMMILATNTNHHNFLSLNDIILFTVGFSLDFALIFWIVFRFKKKLFINLAVGLLLLFLSWGGLVAWLAIGLISKLIGGLTEIEPLETFRPSMSSISMLKRKFLTNLIIGSFLGISFGSITLLIQSLFSVSFFWLSKSISTQAVVEILISNSIIGGAGGLFLGLALGCVSGLIDELKDALKIRLYPNQGIWESLKTQMRITAITFLIIMLFFAWARWFVGFPLGLFIALIIGFSIGGGKAVLQHLSLRIVLWQSDLPWNFKQFLNYCVERRLLLRVGGSYRFLHQELRDHFAQSDH